MSWIDIAIFICYLSAMLGVGFYFMKKNKNTDDYYVGGRGLSSLHIGLSVVATDVGGGFSISLGGLGFIMGVSGSWMLFTGLVGAWLSAVLLIPVVSDLARKKGFLSFPQFLEFMFDKRVAFVAGIISAIGYLGFSSSQILAGAKLASATVEGLNTNVALLVMGIIAVVYTVLGGLKAVVYTDTVQWLILMVGLIFVGLPFAYVKVGGFEVIQETLHADFLSFTAISWQQLVNWGFAIIPIWFVGMTLYQRIYASKDTKTAKKGWFIAGLFEWPIMAFVGVLLGLLARVAFDNGMFASMSMNGVLVDTISLENFDAEKGLPLLLKSVLPVGFLGIVLSAYFSAIMSTADSCLVASSGNILTDVLRKHTHKNNLRYSQILTLIVGTVALLLALTMTSVLDLMLYSYSFMVAGMLVPVLVTIFLKHTNAIAAFVSMILGGGITLLLTFLITVYSDFTLPYGLDPIIFGIATSILAYFMFDVFYSSHRQLIAAKV
ncbi:MAG: sodium:solute symporter family protein [Bacteroidales bacterium]